MGQMKMKPPAAQSNTSRDLVARLATLAVDNCPGARIEWGSVLPPTPHQCLDIAAWIGPTVPQVSH